MATDQLSGAYRDGFAGPSKTWMFLTSLQRRIHGVSRKPVPVRPNTETDDNRLFAKSQQQPGKPGSTESMQSRCVRSGQCRAQGGDFIGICGDPVGRQAEQGRILEAHRGALHSFG